MSAAKDFRKGKKPAVSEDGTPLVKFGHPHEAILEREKMKGEVEARIIEPLALLAGLLAHSTAGEEEDSDTYKIANAAGNLLGLIVQGARKELGMQAYGLDMETLKDFILEKTFEQEEGRKVLGKFPNAIGRQKTDALIHQIVSPSLYSTLRHRNQRQSKIPPCVNSWRLVAIQ